MTHPQASEILRYIRQWAARERPEHLPDHDYLTRFVRTRDEAAFTALVHRHGPMVLRVCRAVLGDFHAAEDAFQATFLVLARKARSIHAQRSLSSWLYKVAQRIAWRAKADTGRQRAREAQSPQRLNVDPLDEVSWWEVQAIFYDELEKLSERYRGPLILCCLEGKARDEAAKQLGCREGTLKSRLERGRRLLRTRLARRGLTLSAGLLATLLAPEGTSAALPGVLISAAIRVSLALGGGTMATATTPVRILTLAEGVIQAMFITKIKVAAAVLLFVVALAATGVGFALQRIDLAPPANAQRQDGVKPAAREADPTHAVAGQAKEDRHDDPLRGTVYAADGAPASGAVVWAAKSTLGPLQRQETIADANGRYLLRLDPGTWFVWARRGSQGREGPARHERVEIAADRAPESITIRLEERGILRGRLLEAETGKPIAGGQFFLDAGLVLTTGADGRFEVGGLWRGGHEAFVVARDRMRMRVLFDTTAYTDPTLDVPVPRSGKIVGRVTDMDGKPIPGAYVGRHTSGSFFSSNGLYVACNAEGRFEYDDAVLPDEPTRLAAAASGYEEEQRHGLHVPSGGKPLELHFRLRSKSDRPPNAQAPDDRKRRVVWGIIRGPDGKPVAGVVVRWGYQPYVGAIQVRTDTEGRFRLTVPDKADMLAVLPRDFAPEFPPVAAGGDQKVDVAVRPGHSARGRVLDDTGKPINGVQLTAVVPSPDPRIGNPYWLSESAVRTDAEGQFELKGVPEGARFDFLKPGLSDLRNQELTLDGVGDCVTMFYGGAVFGQVLDRDGKPVSNFRLLVDFPRERRPDDRTSGFFAGYSGIGVRFTAPDGKFILTGLGAGSVYRITALAEGHGAAVTDRVIAAPVNRLGIGEPAMLRAGPPVALRLRAVSTDGNPIADARVTLVNGQPDLDRSFSWGYHDASWVNMSRGRTAADGWADFPALGIGEATVLVQAPAYARHRVGWRNGQKELTVQLAPEAVVAGEVHDAAGKPVQAFYVNLVSGGDQISASIGPDDKGRFRIGELPAGKWSVIVRGSDGPSTLYQDQVTVNAGETKELKIEVK
jgi:RNA polymerase sigma factor (sigma-70 family)